MVSTRPTKVSKGMSFNRSLTENPIEPPVAWKNEPCGRWSSVVAPALVMAAPQMAVTPAAKMASPKEAEAMVAPAVVEAVAADISAPAIGAINVPPLLQPASKPTSTSLIAEALMIPANVPVPTSKMAMPDIFSNPYDKQVVVWRHLPVAKMPITPPTGRAIIGSMTMSAIGRRANNMMVTKGPIKLRHSGGRSASLVSVLVASSVIRSP